MTREEIIQAISDDKMMPFIQPEQLAQIVAFVINNYQPSLPSDLDEAAEKYSNDSLKDLGAILRVDVRNAFKAGAEWMAGQGVSMLGRIGIYGVDVESITKELREAGFNLGEEIILQIRKKNDL